MLLLGLLNFSGGVTTQESLVRIDKTELFKSDVFGSEINVALFDSVSKKPALSHFDVNLLCAATDVAVWELTNLQRELSINRNHYLLQLNTYPRSEELIA